MIDEEEEMKDFGMIGKTDFIDENLSRNSSAPNEFGVMDKLISSMMNSIMKNMMNEMEKTEVSSLPNGIKIKIGVPARQKQKAAPTIRNISEEQLKRMSSLPRTIAKTSVKRIGDRIIYELNTPGIISPEDIFVSKLESGYEIKAIGEKKVYVNNLPLNLPINCLTVNQDKLFIEFKNHEQ